MCLRWGWIRRIWWVFPPPFSLELRTDFVSHPCRHGDSLHLSMRAMKARYLSLSHPIHTRTQISDIEALFQTKLFATSEVPIFEVFSDDKNDGPQPISDHMRGVMDDLVRPLASFQFG